MNKYVELLVNIVKYDVLRLELSDEEHQWFDHMSKTITQSDFSKMLIQWHLTPHSSYSRVAPLAVIFEAQMKAPALQPKLRAHRRWVLKNNAIWAKAARERLQEVKETKKQRQALYGGRNVANYEIVNYPTKLN